MKNAWFEINRFLGGFLSPAVRVIFLVNVLLTIAYAILTPLFGRPVAYLFTMLAQIPDLAIYHFRVWQFVTYMFLHVDPMHLLGNMLALWFFAPRLEYAWGTRKFLLFYFVTGIGAGLLHAVAAISSGYGGVPMLGASGAVYGIILAYALRWPDDIVYLYFALPIKIKYFAILIGIIAFLGSVNGGAGGGIAHITHLGGFLVAYLFLLIEARSRIPPGPFKHPDYYQ